MKRPPERRSTVATDLASSSGLRYGRTARYVISLILEVTAATKHSAPKGSKVGWPPPSSHFFDGAGWSVNPSWAKPARSTSCAMAATEAGSAASPRTDISMLNCTLPPRSRAQRPQTRDAGPAPYRGAEPRSSEPGRGCLRSRHPGRACPGGRGAPGSRPQAPVSGESVGDRDVLGLDGDAGPGIWEERPCSGWSWTGVDAQALGSWSELGISLPQTLVGLVKVVPLNWARYVHSCLGALPNWLRVRLTGFSRPPTS